MIRKEMVCVRCLMKISASIMQAKAHGWILWVGGAACKTCALAIEAELARGSG